MARLPAMHLAEPPRIARRVGRILTLVFLGLPVVLLFVPWTQNVHGTGRAVAFNPVQRPQFIVSPIEGRIKKWHVVEGDIVRPGQRIVELVDNDPNLELRLLDEERAILDRLRAGEGRVRDIEARIRNLEDSRKLAIAVQSSLLRQEQARVQTFEQELLDAQAVLAAAEPNYKRVKELAESARGGLASRRDYEVARQGYESAQAKVRQSEARVKLGQAAVGAAEDQLSKVDADTAAMIHLETASRRTAEADVASIRRDKAQIEVRIARQRAQYVDSPCHGTVFRLLANAEEGGMLVRPGERLSIIVPVIGSPEAKGASDAPEDSEATNPQETDDEKRPEMALDDAGIAAPAPPAIDAALQPADGEPAGEAAENHEERNSTGLSDGTFKGDESDSSKHEARIYPGIVAELFVDGNDLPLLKKGDPVRLQFEGWPAVQFVGWPSVAVGTFGGRIYLVDPTTNEKGQFRILVEPDPNAPAWPSQDYLRQGVRVQGWALLNRVSLGWELWRNLNGFPPTREKQDAKIGQPLGPVKSKLLK